MKDSAVQRTQTGRSDKAPPRDRILQTAADLFYRHGIHSVGIDRIIAESGVAKMTFYRHFPSKARLVAEYLGQKEQGWQQVFGAITADTSKPVLERVLSIFDALERGARCESCDWLLPLRDGFAFVTWALAFLGNRVRWRGHWFRLCPGGRMEEIG